ncbi:MAG: hypothetical protein PHF97_12630 [Bacteroidales bacterium]|nr:hypothetical protein [Bacteroidales bacterium]
MQQVICDTNVWYYLAKKQIDLSKLNNVQLIGTSVNILEISSTPNLINDLNLIIEVVKALEKYHFKIILSNPYEHIITIFNKGYLPNNKVEEKILNQFIQLMGVNPLAIKEVDYKNALTAINKIIEPQLKIVEYINNGLPIIRQNIKRLEGKDQHRKKDQTLLWKKLIIEFVAIYSKENCDKEYVIDIEDKRWDYLNFFIYTWEAYFKKLELDNRNFDKNDWQDLFNLVYVQEGYKYWTFEKKWNVIYDENPILLKYKFNYNGT